MHPDTIIAGLRRELERTPAAKEKIEAEIRKFDAMERPAPATEESQTSFNREAWLLEGLKRELERAPEAARDAVRAEIKRVEALIHKEAGVADDKPSADEIEQRKQARTGQQVERATNEPGGRPAPASAPTGADKE